MTAEPTEARLVTRARAGDADALAELYRRYAEQVYSVALRMTASEHDAEDVTQNVFIGLPEALGAYAGTGGLAAWIRRVATRTALLFLREHRRRAKREGKAARFRPEAADPTPVEARVTLERALDLMPEDLRVIYVLYELEGHSHPEIADLLGISTGLSTVRLHRARKFLRRLLQDRI